MRIVQPGRGYRRGIGTAMIAREPARLSLVHVPVYWDAGSDVSNLGSYRSCNVGNWCAEREGEDAKVTYGTVGWDRTSDLRIHNPAL